MYKFVSNLKIYLYEKAFFFEISKFSNIAFYENKNTVETKQWLDKHCPNSAPSRLMVKKWIEVIVKTKASFDEKDKSFNKSGVEKLKKSLFLYSRIL